MAEEDVSGSKAKTCRIVRNPQGEERGHVCVLPNKDLDRNDLIWNPSDTRPAKNLRSTAELINELKKEQADKDSIELTLEFVDARLRSLDASRRRAV